MCLVREYNCLIYRHLCKTIQERSKINPLWADRIHPCGYLLLCGYTAFLRFSGILIKSGVTPVVNMSHFGMYLI